MDKQCIGAEEGLIRDVLHGQGGRVRDGASDDSEAHLVKPGIGFCSEIGE